MFIAALFTIAMIKKKTKCPSMGKCTKKMWDIHATDYSAMRKEYIPPFVTTWMDLKYFVLSKTSQTEKDKYCVVSWRRQWQPTPVLLPGKSHGWRSLVGCSPLGREESDMTK